MLSSIVINVYEESLPGACGKLNWFGYGMLPGGGKVAYGLKDAGIGGM